MNLLSTLKLVPIIQPQAIKDDAYWVGSHTSTPVNVDTKGFGAALIVFQLGATDIAVAELSVFESNTTTDGDFAIIAASNFATSPATLPSATDDNLLFGVLVTNLGTTRKRYLRLNAKGGNGTSGGYASAFALLALPEQGIDSVSEAGFSQLLTV